MKLLFVHQNFPGQYKHLVTHFAALPGNEIVFITQHQNAPIPGVKCIVYKPQRATTPNIHHYLQDTEAGILNAQAVLRIALQLKASGFTPDIMLGHNGWGEIWYLKEAYPTTPLIGYFEFYYRMQGADIGFNPDDPIVTNTAPRIRSKNIGNLMGLDAADIAQTPTQWQKSGYPKQYQPKLHVIHEGINTQQVKPDPTAQVHLPGSETSSEASSALTFTVNDEVITYVARNLEPYRGFYSFMRSLPAILQQRSKAHVLIVGGDETSYGHRLPAGQSHRQIMLKELGDSLDMQRIHFLGKVPYANYLKILQISSVHVYLTYPFVLSWSMLEAMSAGCCVVASNTAPVVEVIRDGENGVLVDFFSPEDIAKAVTTILAQGRDSVTDIWQSARQTIIERYDLHTVCLPAQLRLIEQVIQQSRRMSS